MSGRVLASIKPHTAAGLPPAELARKAGAGDVDAALVLQLLEAGQAEESFNWMLTAAKDGHPVAVTELGLRLIIGHGAPQDPPAGIKWIRDRDQPIV